MLCFKHQSTHQFYSQSIISQLLVSIALMTASSTAFSAGLDRTGQDIRGFFNEGMYVDTDFVYVSTDISGHDNGGNSYGITATEADYVQGESVGNSTPNASFINRFSAKTDIGDKFTVGLFYDQPWGADVEFSGNSSFVSNPNQEVIIAADNPVTFLTANDPLVEKITSVDSHINESGYDLNTAADLQSETLTALVGFKQGGFQLYGGPVMQNMEADVRLRGNAYGPLTGYSVEAPKNTAYGWAAGVSYSIPEIMLNAALTYRSEIEHEGSVTESIPALRREGILTDFWLTDTGIPIHFPLYVSGKMGLELDEIQETITSTGTITTPESINLNLQSGLSEKYQLLGSINARWVPWSDFEIRPPYYSAFSKASYPDGLALLSYDKDQYSVDVGLGKRFSDNLAASAIIGWDSGTGNPASSIGSIDGAWSIGGGIKYNVTDEFAVTAGGKYMMFGDATATLPNGSTVGKYGDNDGYAAVIKLSYHNKD